MKVIKELRVTAEELFLVLQNSLEYDIETYGRKEPGSYKLEEGFCYHKKLKRGKRLIRTTVEITQFAFPHSYESIMKTDHVSFQMRYEIKPLEHDDIEVTYSEEVLEEDGKIKHSLPNKIFGKIQSGSVKKRFEYMEKNILEKREEKVGQE